MQKQVTREIKYFQSYLSSIKNVSNKTIENYTIDLVLLENFLSENKKTLLNANNDDIYEYLNSQEFKSKTYNRKVTSIKEFYKFLIAEKYNISVNINKIEHIKNEKVYPKIIKFEDISKMVSVQENTTLGMRNKVIIMFLYITGLRVSELCNLTYSDINFQEGYIRCIGKGNKEKIIMVGELLSINLSAYTNTTRKEILNGLESKYVFVNSEGDPLSRQAIFNIIKDAASKADIKLHVSPHTLRHCFATHMLENGADVRTVQELLGHTDISTTQVYLNISNKAIKNAYLSKFKDPLLED